MRVMVITSWHASSEDVSLKPRICLWIHLPLLHNHIRSLTSEWRHNRHATNPRRAVSDTLLIISIFLLRWAFSVAFSVISSFKPRVYVDEYLDPYSSNFVESVSCIAGDGKGLDDAEIVPSIPLSPLCGRLLGAGNPFKKCSSSASVPLSLGVDS
jgi:hypothetical protein